MKMKDILAGFKGKYVTADRGSSDFSGGEFEIYHALAKLIAPESVLEIGVYCGYSAASIIAGSQQTLKQYTGVDAELYRSDSNREALNIIQQMQWHKQTNVVVELLRLNTQIESLGDLADRNFDWIHIDAGHSKQEALRDIIQFWPMVKKVMTVHDVSSHLPVREAIKDVTRRHLIDNCAASMEVKSLHGFHLFFR